MKNFKLKNNAVFVSVLMMALFFIFFTFFDNARAEECRSIVKVTTRDSQGVMIKNINWQLWTQTNDADGNPLRFSKVSSSNTGLTAWSEITFNPSSIPCQSCQGLFAIRVYDTNENVGDFNYYDIPLGCGMLHDVTYNLSSLKVILKDKNLGALKNRKFEIYSQINDVEGNPIIDKVVSTNLTTGDSGVKYVYLTPGKYVIKIPAIDNKFNYTKYNIDIRDKAETVFDFTLNKVSVSIRDGSGNLQVNNVFEVYKQSKDADGKEILGELVGKYDTGLSGVKSIFLPNGNYAIRFFAANNQYYYLWNQQINEEQTYDISYNLSNVNVVIRDGEDNLLTNRSFEIYNQIKDADGEPILGSLVGRYNTGTTGISSVFLASGTYVFRFNGSGESYHYLWNQQIDSTEAVNISYKLGTLKVVPLGIENKPLNNLNISIYEQKYNEINEPIIGKKITSGNSGVEGSAVFYLSSGKYAIEINGPDNNNYYFWNKDLENSKYNRIEQILSALDIVVRNGQKELVTDINVEIYQQAYDAENKEILGKSIGLKSTGKTGRVSFYYPKGNYAVKIKGTAGFDYYFWEKEIIDHQISKINIALSTLRIISRDSAGNLAKNVSAIVATQTADYEGNLIIDRQLGTFNTGEKGYVDVYLPLGNYALIVGTEKKFDIQVSESLITKVEIEKSGEDIKIENVIGPESSASVSSESEDALRERIRNLEYRISELEIKVIESERLLTQRIDQQLTDRLSGRILLQVEENGEAWYVDPDTNKRYYLKDGDSAYVALNAFGLGISNDNLEKIPVGVENRADLLDDDGDGLDNKLEESLGTNLNDPDSDNDGYNDGVEIINQYNPSGFGRLSSDSNLANNLKGKILLQVESKGEAWYVNPDDGKRYYMKDGELAYQIMRFKSLGIKNDDLRKIEVGSFE